ncbi:hypothetical protein [Hazenella coriacea]|uniref:Uncharacterized protein n=1 Tax=Hazenella coriacea TaxID=1179467 RepID=A0A4R3L7Y0_9BACL|nr:hypothetical protein [Hazenella coriacea]TCS95739.1 hypothetical protein EDD58_102319 [Hazenella coriacea]
MFTDVKEILYRAFNIQKFRYWNRKHSCTWYWCYRLDEGIWIEPRFFDEKVKLFDNFDVLRYDGELSEEFGDLLKVQIKQE